MFSSSYVHSLYDDLGKLQSALNVYDWVAVYSLRLWLLHNDVSLKGLKVDRSMSEACLYYLKMIKPRDVSNASEVSYIKSVIK